jgi:hypothetical protein
VLQPTKTNATTRFDVSMSFRALSTTRFWVVATLIREVNHSNFIDREPLNR